ncbi:MAG: porin family protein [Desulfobacteraceae bacterium]|nr:porin family protein [Desulfobacteraceae bacterium]
MRILKVVLGVLFFMVLTQGANLGAQESDFYPEEGFYVGISWVYNSIGKDFDETGSSGYIHEITGDIYIVPEVDDAMGFGVSAGYRYEKFALELSYQRVVHDTHTIYSLIGDQKAYYNVIDLNAKIDVFANGRFRPFALIGIGATWLEIENHRVYNNSDAIAGETFEGYSVNGGGGFSYYFNPKWFLTATAMYRWQPFKKVDHGYLSIDAMGNGMNFSVGIAYTF